MAFFAVPLFFLWLGVWLWMRGRRRDYYPYPPILIVTQEELDTMLNSQVSDEAAMVRTLHQIRDLEEAQ